MTSRDLANIIFNTNNEPFFCIFNKRTTGEVREMRAQLGVKKDLKGVGLPFVPKEHNLIVAFDLDKDGYRMIPIEGLLKVEYKGQIFEIEGDIE